MKVKVKKDKSFEWFGITYTAGQEFVLRNQAVIDANPEVLEVLGPADET